GIEVRKLFRYLDFGDVQGYDLRGSWEPLTGHNGNLYADRKDPNDIKFSVDGALNAYLCRGADRDKLVMGIPPYGQQWSGVGATNTGLFQPGTGVGQTSYRTLSTTAGQRYYDKRTGAAWLYDGSNFWSFDDVNTVKQKARYIEDHDLAG